MGEAFVQLVAQVLERGNIAHSALDARGQPQALGRDLRGHAMDAADVEPRTLEFTTMQQDFGQICLLYTSRCV